MLFFSSFFFPVGPERLPPFRIFIDSFVDRFFLKKCKPPLETIIPKNLLCTCIFENQILIYFEVVHSWLGDT